MEMPERFFVVKRFSEPNKVVRITQAQNKKVSGTQYKWVSPLYDVSMHTL